MAKFYKLPDVDTILPVEEARNIEVVNIEDILDEVKPPIDDDGNPIENILTEE